MVSALGEVSAASGQAWDIRIRGRWHIDAEAIEFQNVTLDTNGSHVEVPVVHLGYGGVPRRVFDGIKHPRNRRWI